MAIEIRVPSPGESITQVQLAKWLVAEGAAVDKDQEIVEIDSSIIPAVGHVDVEMKMQLEKVYRAVKELKPDYQDVIILRFIEDLPLKETAAILKKSEGAIKLAQHRAIIELKKKLGDESLEE